MSPRYIGALIGNLVLVECVFDYPGLGQLLVRAVASRDLPVVAGAVLAIAMLLIAFGLLIGLLHAALDPRERTA